MDTATTQTAQDQSEQDRIAAVIAEQNDRFRKTWGADFTVPGRIVMTRGVADLGYAEQAQIMQAVQQYNDFTEDNDPYGQHDFGVFTIQSQGKPLKLYWKIDLYDRDYTYGAVMPTSLADTRRVLTVLFPSDY